ncbi:MAG: TatD family hydrolase, partial [Nitrososphaerales archaeon]
DCADFGEETLGELRDLARRPKVVAIGEIGLDYYWERVDHEQQKRALEAQLALAGETGLPVILHTRNAQDGTGACTEDLLYLLSQWVSEIRSFRAKNAILGVWHAFSGTLEQAQRAYDLGLVLGLGGPVTFQNARKLHALIAELDLDRLILETDAPYLAPHPYRGQRNEPGYLPLVVEALARLTGKTADEIAAQTTATARRCFTLE